MNHKKELIKIILASIFIALGIVLPFITLNNQQLGSIFSLMHIPVLIGGLILGWKYGLVIGLITPILRFGIVSMPPLHVALTMMFELATYGAVIALAHEMLPKKKSYMVEVSLLIAMLLGRFVWGIAAAIIYPAYGIDFGFKIFIASGFVKAVPALIIQFLLVPNLFYRLKNTGVLDKINLGDGLTENEKTF